MEPSVRNPAMICRAALWISLVSIMGISASGALNRLAANASQKRVIHLPSWTIQRAPIRKPSTPELFDDFAYTNHKQMLGHGWIIRTAAGWPGIPGATWATNGVSFLADPDQPGNRLLRMTSSTDGTGANTRQTQICHQRKYLEGTYAARVRFFDLPAEGPSGDQLVESFYTICPLK
jgi:hypothetical protein